jgi:hypothetical protein
MFTDHDVEFKFSDDKAELLKHFNEILPVINWRLSQMGETYDELPEDRKFVVNSGIGSISGKIPMLCFTEVAEGKVITNHGISFGNYGLVVSREWLESNGGDRVAYVGEGGMFGVLLARVLSAFKALTLFKNEEELVLFNGHFTDMVLSLFSYVEKRRHLEEQEWRIAGNHGFLGGEKSTGSCLPISLKDIEFVFVREGGEIDKFKSILDEISRSESFHGKKPEVLVYPERISK